MEATTKLQFTLTSPGTQVPSYTVVGSPNTGENSASSDNVSGTVFATLFIIIGFAALAIFLVRYLKKNRRISFAEKGSFHISARPRVFATVSLALAVAFLGGLTITNIYNNAEKDTNAASQRELKVSAASSIVFDVERGQNSIKSDTIKVENNGARYDLYAYTTDNKFALEGNPSVFLSPVKADITADTASLTAPAAGEWGMSIQNINNPNIGGKIWGAAPTKETKIDENATSGSKTVHYAVNLSNDLKDGTYSTTVSYKAIAKNYQVTTIKGFVNATGELTNAWFDDGVTVIIRPNCGAEKFLYWTSNDIDVASISGPTGDNLYQFVMPAKDVVLTAHCENDPEPDPSEADWIIKYDANHKGATGDTPETPVFGDFADLRKNGFVVTNYTFQGWACNKTATAADFTDEQKGITQQALEAKGCVKTPGDPEADPATKDSYTIYALWKIKDMWIQEVTPEMCDNMDIFEIVTLPDKRTDAGSNELQGYTYDSTYQGQKTPDGQKHIWYSYTKFADGRCWMLQDLAYQPGTGQVALTADGTDIDADRTVNFASSYHVGTGGYSNLYNFKAASAGWNGSLNTEQNIPDSLCPRSWKIPDAWNVPNNAHGDSSGELRNLANFNIGVANGGGNDMTDSWKMNFLLGGSTITVNNKSFPAPQFKYNGT